MFPDLKSNAEKFAKLSDSFSPAEGDFVQEVFEPDMGEKLGRIVQELAKEADQGAEEDRRNIELALRHSYKGSLLVVGIGLAVSAVLALVISRGVIGPIQKLRDTAHQLSQGKMDARILLNSKDELGELGGSFNLMADNLTKLMEERGKAQAELSVAQRKTQEFHGRAGIAKPGGRNA